MEQTSMSLEGYEHSEWLHSLDSYKEELGVLRDRLTELGKRDMGHEAAISLEQFENRFRLQRDNIDRLRHNIKQNRNAFRRLADQQAKDPQAGAEYEQLIEAFNAEEQAVKELQNDFHRFSGAV